MTNEEAIKNIVAYVYFNIEDIPEEVRKAFDIAITALKEKQNRTQGEWIEQGYLEYKCSVCGRHISLEDHWTNITKDFPFCHCGADMRGTI